VVKPGEDMVSIAHAYGFSDYRAIIDHPRNRALKSERPNLNMLVKGDIIYIPERKEKTVSITTGRWITFTKPAFVVFLRLVLRAWNGRPYAFTKYRLEIGSDTYEGRTDQYGKLERKIPIGASEADLEIFVDEPIGMRTHIFPLAIGSLEPAETASGRQARLFNLGYIEQGASFQRHPIPRVWVGLSHVATLVVPGVHRTTLDRYMEERYLNIEGEKNAYATPERKGLSGFQAQHGLANEKQTIKTILQEHDVLREKIKVREVFWNASEERQRLCNHFFKVYNPETEEIYFQGRTDADGVMEGEVPVAPGGALLEKVMIDFSGIPYLVSVYP